MDEKDRQLREEAQRHIQRLRQEKYGIGVAGDNPLAADLHQAVHHLSQELYRKDTHFIFELIQNAEDNSYPLGEQPMLMFCLVKGDPTAGPVAGESEDDADSADAKNEITLCVFNNESGFKPEHVDALCKVGGSTKMNKSFGYIGEKGIGFKSVFVVCEQPTIVSNGYRFRFDEKKDPEAGLGYIVPSWSPNNRPTFKQLSKLGAPGSTRTAILLPLKQDKRAQVQKQIGDISPDTILFLRKLELLVIIDKVQERPPISVKKSPVRQITPALKIVEMRKYAMTPVHYAVQERSYGITDDVLSDPEVLEKRDGVKIWTVHVAFPLDLQEVPKHDVFAFLPTEVSTGWPFYINADFFLVSSREGLKYESPWNLGILGCVRDAAVSGIMAMQQSIEPLPFLEGPPYEVLRFVPLSTLEASFEPLRRQMLAELATYPCVPVFHICAPFEDVQGVVTRGYFFALPRAMKIGHMEFVQILQDGINEGADLPVTLSSRFENRKVLVDPEAAQKYGKQLKALGVQKMTPQDVRVCCADATWTRVLSVGLFVRLLEFLMQIFTQEDMSPLARADFLRLDTPGGQETHPTTPIYLPPAQQDEWLSQTIANLQSVAPVQVLDRKLYSAIIASENGLEILAWLRRVLGVKDLSTETYAEQLVMAAQGLISEEELLKVTEALRKGVQQHLLRPGKNLDLSTLPVLSSDNIIVPQKPTEYFTNAVGNRPLLLPASVAEWPPLLEKDRLWGAKVVKLSDKYIGENGPPEERSARAAFLREYMKAVDICDLEPKGNDVLLKLDRLNESGGGTTGLGMEGARTLILWVATLMQKFGIREGNDSWCWETKPEKTRRGWTQGPSPFALQLKNTPWVPTNRGAKRPSEAFIWSPLILQLLGDSLPFMSTEAVPSGDRQAISQAVGWLGIKVDVQPNDIVQHLHTLSKGHPGLLDRQTVSSMYMYLANKDYSPDPRDRSWNLFPIWIPPIPPKEAEWRTPQNCVWDDPSGLFSPNRYAALRKHYRPGLAEFFSHLGVLPEPSVGNYMHLWLRLCNRQGAGGRLKREVAEKVWTKIAQMSVEAQQDKLWQSFKTYALLPIDSGDPGGVVEINEEEEDLDDEDADTAPQPATQTPNERPGVSHGDLILIKSPVDCFIPDDLNLQKVYSKDCSSISYVFQLPSLSTQDQGALFATYSELGASFLHKASETIVSERGTPVPLPFKGPQALAETLGIPKRILDEPLFVTLLGYLSSPTYNTEAAYLTEEKRRKAVLPLVQGKEIIVDALEVTYRLRSPIPDHPPVAEVHGHLTAHWKHDEGCLYRTKDTRKATGGTASNQVKLAVAADLAHALASAVFGTTGSLNVVRLQNFLQSYAMVHFRNVSVRMLLERANIRVSDSDKAWIKEGAPMAADVAAPQPEDLDDDPILPDADMHAQNLKMLDLNAIRGAAAAASALGPMTSPNANGMARQGLRQAGPGGGGIRDEHMDDAASQGPISQAPLRTGNHKSEDDSEAVRQAWLRLANERDRSSPMETNAKAFPQNGGGGRRGALNGPPSVDADGDHKMQDVPTIVARQYGSLKEYIASQAGSGDKMAIDICSRMDFDVVMPTANPQVLLANAREAWPPTAVSDRWAAVHMSPEDEEKLLWWKDTHLHQVHSKLAFAQRNLPADVSRMLDRCLLLAFLHRSYFGRRSPSYERLEFLGDVWLNAVISSRLYEMHPDKHEGVLSEMRSALVRNQTNAIVLRAAGLEPHIIIADSEKVNGQVPESVAADVYEAVLGAVFFAFGRPGPQEVYVLLTKVLLPAIGL